MRPILEACVPRIAVDSNISSEKSNWMMATSYSRVRYHHIICGSSDASSHRPICLRIFPCAHCIWPMHTFSERFVWIELGERVLCALEFVVAFLAQPTHLNNFAQFSMNKSRLTYTHTHTARRELAYTECMRIAQIFTTWWCLLTFCSAFCSL